MRKTKNSELELFLGLRSLVRALVAITCSKFRTESYPLLASSQYARATAAVNIIGWIVFGWIVCILLAELSEFQIGLIVFGRIIWTQKITSNFWDKVFFMQFDFFAQTKV